MTGRVVSRFWWMAFRLAWSPRISELRFKVRFGGGEKRQAAVERVCLFHCTVIIENMGRDMGT